MAFFGGLSGWRGSSWSPWSALGSDSDSNSDSDAVTTTTQAVQTPTPDPTTATATVVQQVTTTAVSVITPSSSTPKQVTITQTQTPKPSSALLPSTIATQSSKPSSTQQQQQQSSSGAASSAQSSQAFSSARPSSLASSTSTASADSSDGGEIPDDWTYYGCVPNLDGMPALNTTYATSNELTPSLCISACAASQYHFAGLQNGNACFCGSTITSATLSSSSSSSSCSSSCSGDPTGSSKCGGPSSMSFYHLRSINPNSLSSSDPNPSSSSTLTSLSDEYGVGSTTIVAKLPEFTGTLMEYGDPNFRSGRDGVVFGEMFKVSSSNIRCPLNLDGISWIVLLGWFGMRVLR
ncbi:hypothetical protein I302_104812 [Kwoniella bestiolae CBS 10118]|uniref:WSC domain-containing protein n=1 Tax=Kwoniella bestiolae CBS 10118 TaxID=1296100 RepID=A0A1B9FRP1_9TREE|nr:hypothetical protein I302_09119 [Kwoniella bestiolae CBS 10118]OCF21440.1 hypothetical protein I302_09119 [Kwoniella bestiolae CBS 10118]